MIRTNLPPRTNPAKRLVVEAGFLALARGLQACSNFEPQVQADLDQWPEAYSFAMTVLPHGPTIRMQKRQGLLWQTRTKGQHSDLVVELKNLETAFQMISTQAGIHHVYAHHGIGVVGDIARSMALIRMIERVEAYLFPEVLSRNILKRTPQTDWQFYLRRARLLGFGLLFGK